MNRLPILAALLALTATTVSAEVIWRGDFETRNSWSQLMAFEVTGEDILFTTRVPYKRQWSGKGKMTPGKWHDFAVHVLWSRDPKNGFVEVWFDGEKVAPLSKTATLKDEN